MRQSSAETRKRIVGAAMGAFRTRSSWSYAQIRPIPYARFMALLDGHPTQVTTDCSGLASCAYFRAGAGDPNGLNYNGQGFTGTMLNHLPVISAGQAKPGDLVVFGPFPGDHVVVIVGEGFDPMCVSHGGPGDPKLAPLSHFEGLGHMTFLRGVPFLARIRKTRKPRWRVVGDNGHVISHVYHTRFGWWVRHRQLAKNQREQLAFHRIH